MKKLIYLLGILFAVSGAGFSQVSEGSSSIEEGLEYLLFQEVPATIASKVEEKADTVPAIVTVISAEEMQRRGIKTISEALQRVPGFFPSRQVFHDDLLGVRGYFYHCNDKIVLLLDGHNISRFGWLSVQTGDLDEVMSLDKVARIEVIHGPGSIVWGDNALLTVINVVTKNPRDIDGLKIKGAYGDHADGGGKTQIASAIYGKELSEKNSIMVSFNVPVVDGWTSHDYSSWMRKVVLDEVTVDNFNNEVLTYEYYGKANIGTWSLWFRAMNSHQKIVNHQYPASTAKFEDDWDYSPQVFTMVSKKSLEFNDEFKADFELGFDRYHFTGYGQSWGGGNDNVGSREAVNMCMDHNVLNTSLDFNYTKLQDHTIRFGFEYILQQFESSRITPIDLSYSSPNYNTATPVGYVGALWDPGNDQTGALYITDAWKITPNFRLHYGSRAEWNDVRDDGNIVFSPRVGLIFNTEDEKLIGKLLYNTGYRRATWWQSNWAYGLMGRTDWFVEDPEYVNSYDLQIIWNMLDRTKLNLTIFTQKVENIILSGNAQGKPGWLNAGDFESNGIEMSFDVGFGKNNFTGINLAWLNDSKFVATYPTVNELAFNNADGTFLDYPGLMANAYVNIMWTDHIYSDLTVRYLSQWPGRELLTPGSLGVPAANNQEVEINNIYYLDLVLGAKGLLDNRFDIALRVRNLLNNRDRVPQGQGDHDLYEPEPRYIEVSAGYKF
ncbi:MAG: TonB-dependent receptor [Candidatus Aureabacteria bacterium]|nr:TonB-dependent receptor [Candidatus Auribacterota bacterium]